MLTLQSAIVVVPSNTEHTLDDVGAFGLTVRQKYRRRTISISDTHDLFMKKVPRAAMKAVTAGSRGGDAGYAQQCIIIRYAKGYARENLV